MSGKLMELAQIEEKNVKGECVDKILEILNQNNVKITFFMVGDWIDKYPEAVKKINEAGQEIRKS